MVENDDEEAMAMGWDGMEWREEKRELIYVCLSVTHSVCLVSSTKIVCYQTPHILLHCAVYT